MVRIAAHAALYCAGDCAGKSAVTHALQCSLPGAFPASGYYLDNNSALIKWVESNKISITTAQIQVRSNPLEIPNEDSSCLYLTGPMISYTTPSTPQGSVPQNDKMCTIWTPVLITSFI